MKRGKIDYKYNWKMYFHFLKKVKYYVLLLLFIVFIYEASFVVDKFIFKELIDRGTLFAAGQTASEQFTTFIGLIGVLFLTMLLLRVVAEWFKQHFINYIEAEVVKGMKKHFFNHLVHLSHEFYTKHKTGALISRLVRGGSAMERMTDTLVFNFLPLIFQFVVVFTTIAYFDLTSAFIILFVVVLFLVYSFFIQSYQQKAHILSNDAEDREKAFVSDVFTNIDSIKYFGKEDATKKKFSGFSK